MTLSPRQRDILENIESLFQDQDPDLASQLTGMRFRERGPAGAVDAVADGSVHPGAASC
jgi:Protein of unknown function (DUF3040)